MRTLIISRSQFGKLNESELNTVHFQNPEEISPEIINQADRKYNEYNVEIGSEDDDIKNIPVDLKAEPGTSSANIKSEAEKQVNDDPNSGDLNIIATVRNGQLEGRVYSKKTLEEMRLENIRRNGYVMTKKELNEHLKRNAR